MKTTDFKRVRAVNDIFQLRDVNDTPFLNPIEWCDCKIKFGNENKKGIGSCSIKVTILDNREYVDINFYGFYHHIQGLFEIKSVLFEYSFGCQRLVSVNELKINCVWLREEEGEADAPAVVGHAITFPEAEFGSENSVEL